MGFNGSLEICRGSPMKKTDSIDETNMERGYDTKGIRKRA